YVATVSSSTKKPFIAIVTVKDGADPFAYMNSDTDEENFDSDSSDQKNSSKGSDTDTEKESEKKERPEYTEISYRAWDYVYMNEGKGEFELDGKYEPNDFEIKTYLSGDVLTSDDFESIKFDYVKYYDYDYVYKDKNDNEQTCKETRCNYVVNMKMKKPKTGVLFYTVHNTVTGKDSEVFQVAVNEGEICDKTYNGDRDRSMVGFNEEFGSLVESLGINQLKLFVPEFSVLPYKNRSNNAFEIKDMYFVPSNHIDSGAVSADKYYYDDYSGTYDCYTTWTAEVTMNEHVDGFLVYSRTLNQGGDKSQAGKTESHVAVMGSGISIIEAKDYYDKGFIDKDDFETPNYSFLYLGYVPVKTIDEK
ncbi:MAG: hypothetical protein II931_03635, partial [Clostridia bacterium]|nr:hypothetical protein [Clostridia bacterium]